MLRVICKWLAIMLVAPVMAVSAFAEKRLALVIGMNDYAEVPKLEKAVGDAEAIAQAVSQIGFDVTTAFNLDRRALNVTLSTFYEKIEAGDTVLIHFSGHGVQLKNENYLLPIDIPAPTNGNADLVQAESLRLQSLVESLADKGAGARIVIVDACRDNPFAAGGKRSIGGTRGLASISPAKGDFVMFSAGAGQAALDRLGDNDPVKTSVFTRVLVSRLTTPGMKLRDLAATIKEDVEGLGKTVGHTQRPAYYDDLPESFSLVPSDQAAVPPAKVELQPVAPQPPPASGLSEERAFKLAETINTIDGWKAFLDRFPDGDFALFAKAAREKLVAEKVALEKPKPVPVKPPKKVVEVKPEPTRTADGCSSAALVSNLPDSDNFLSVRTGPGVGFTEIDRLFNGDGITICGRQGKWLRIKYGSGRGWVSSKYVSQ